MGPLTEFVVRTAARDLARWLHVDPELQVAVNVSAQNLHDLDFPKFVARTLAETDLPPRALEIEITENAVLAHPDRARAVLQTLSQAGVRITIDDFGTGFSSLANLRQLPVQEIKIDRSFVRDMATRCGRPHRGPRRRRPRPPARPHHRRRGCRDAGVPRPAAGDRLRRGAGLPDRATDARRRRRAVVARSQVVEPRTGPPRWPPGGWWCRHDPARRLRGHAGVGAALRRPPQPAGAPRASPQLADRLGAGDPDARHQRDSRTSAPGPATRSTSRRTRWRRCSWS